jgi:hypothetical protein
MEFTEGLFRGFKTLNSLIHTNNIWCRITEIRLLAHPIRLSKRLAIYQVGYWTEEPTPESNTSMPLILTLDRVPYDTFFVYVPSNINDLPTIERICFEDFEKKKMIGREYLTDIKTNQLLSFYQNGVCPHNVVTSDDKTTRIRGMVHETVYLSDGLNALELTSEEGHILEDLSRKSFPQTYLDRNEWIRPLVENYVLPNTLKALVTITN